MVACRKLCRHCQRRPVNRPKSMCWSCYYTPGVRALYPSTSKFARRGEPQDFYGSLPLPAEPTDAIPGSEAKVQALEDRAGRGRGLWHPRDATFAQTPPPVFALANGDDDDEQ